MNLRDFFANLVVVFHGVFLVVLFAGPFLSAFGWFKRRPILEWIYVTFLLLGIAGFAIARECLCTRLEYRIRGSEYPGGCVKHYLGLVGIPVEDIWVFWATVLAVAAGLLLTLGRRLWVRFSAEQTADK